MSKLTENILLVAAGVTVGAIGYMAFKHSDELKKMVDGAVALGEKVLNGDTEAVVADGPTVQNDDLGEKNE